MLSSLLRASLALPCLVFSAAAASDTLPLTVAVDQPAYVGEPFWIEATAGPVQSIRYPFHAAIEDIGCNRLEVKHDGMLLKPLPVSGYANRSGIACGSAAPPSSPEHRLPLHALFPIVKAGTYSVRWTILTPSGYAKGGGLKPQAQSGWVKFEVLQPASKQREEWLQNLLANPPQDPGQLAGDFLPSLLAAAPDARALRTFVKYLYEEDSMGSELAASGLDRFPLPEVRHVIVETIVEHGPSRELAYFASFHKGWTQDDESKVVHATVPYLNPSKTALSLSTRGAYGSASTSAALMLLRFILFDPHIAWPRDGELNAYANAQVIQVAPSIIANADAHTNQQLAENLGSMPATIRSHELLFRIAQRPDVAGEQARICLTWHPRSSDLPRLAAFLTAPGDRDPGGGDRSSLPYSLVRGYGDQALPYLERAVKSSPYLWVRTQSAEQLALHDRAVGFQFLLEAVEGDQTYRAEMIQWIRDTFASVLPRAATEAQITTFLRERLSGPAK